MRSNPASNQRRYVHDNKNDQKDQANSFLEATRFVSSADANHVRKPERNEELRMAGKGGVSGRQNNNGLMKKMQGAKKI